MSRNSSGKLFDGGVAVITGAGSGIGAALARHAVTECGMRVVLADIAADRIDALAAELEQAGAEVLPVVTDVSDADSMECLARATHERYGDVTLLVNNAGIEALGFSWKMPAEQWDRILNVNIHGVVHGVRAFAPAMIDSARPCVIANLSSIGGLAMTPFQTSYVMSKHAVLSFSECLKLELALVGALVQVSAILPGPVATRIFEDTEPPADQAVFEHREMMREMVTDNGMSPDEAAAIIFPQLAAGEFWVSTHPELTQLMAARRAEYLSGLQDPVLPATEAEEFGTRG